NRAGSAFFDGRNRPIDACNVERPDNLAVMSHALVHLINVPAGDERSGGVQIEIVGGVTRLPANDKDIAKSTRRDQCGLASSPLENGVGGDGCRMQDELDILRCDLALTKKLAKPCERCPSEVGRSGRNLVEQQAMPF